jgi:hypothetical protein
MNRSLDKQMQALARRVHLRILQYRRRHPRGPGVIDDTMSRILEHEPEYVPYRARRGAGRAPLANPGIFTVQRIAETLETTVGDLLNEKGYQAPRDLLTDQQRRTLRDAVRILVDLFDLRAP